MNQQFIANEPLKAPDALTLDAQERYSMVSAEMEMRKALGLIPQDLDGRDAIASYLEGVSRQDIAIDVLTNEIAANLDTLSRDVEMIITIPILGIDGQETETATRLIEVLSQQEEIKSGKVAVFIYVNWPEGREPDNTYETLINISEGLPIYVFGAPVPRGAGRSDSPLYTQTAEELDDGPQIALIRDILNIVVMRKFLASRCRKTPIILQSDADLVSISPYALRNISNRFRQDPDLQFLQCIVDWDGEMPTADILPLQLGSILMREFPWQILKASLNTARNPLSRTQVIFSDAIQRGIQVAQAEKLDSIAKKGGYGLLKINEDELDLNMRATSLIAGSESIGATNDTFSFSNRRAIVSWFLQAIPPISQWATVFEIDDRVRTIKLSPDDIAERIEQRGIRFEIINALSLTLQRFSIPQRIPEVYDDGIGAILAILAQIGLSPDMLLYEIADKGDGTYYIDLKDVCDEGLSGLINTLS